MGVGILERKIEDLKKELIKSDVFEKEDMAKHTSFKAGGKADIFVEIKDKRDISVCGEYFASHKIPVYFMGNGSNLLVTDAGFRGAIVKIGSGFSEIKAEGTKILVQAGALLSVVAQAALEKGLGGFEFASGIPGSFGGAVVMNAGAYGREMKDVLERVEFLDERYQIRSLSLEGLGLSYRKSIFMEKDWIVLSGTLSLEEEDREKIQEKMQELSFKRREKQPLSYPSAGSTFKRPEGYFAGKLIEDAGLKGMSIGGAQISEKHCGFLINKGGATAKDILDLISYCQKTVWEKFQVKLEPEVRIIGEGEKL